jgi:hypothetical protein
MSDIFGGLLAFVFVGGLLLIELALLALVVSVLLRLHKALGIYISEHEPVTRDKNELR